MTFNEDKQQEAYMAGFRYKPNVVADVDQMPPMTITPHTITIMLDNQPCIVADTHPNFLPLKEAIKEKNWESVAQLAKIETAVLEFVKNGNVTVENGTVYYTDDNGQTKDPCEGYVVDRILQFMQEGIDAAPLMNFLNLVMQNSSFRVIKDLYTFLANRNMPLDQDGCFYGYKAIRNNWMDKHSNSISNRVGQILRFKRNKVDDNPQNDCSYGLHVGSLNYVKSFAQGYNPVATDLAEETDTTNNGDRIVIVKVDPRDVVAVPSYDTTKLRCCKYEVIAEFTGILPDTTWEKGEQTINEGTDRNEEFDYEDNLEWDENICEFCGSEDSCDC